MDFVAQPQAALGGAGVPMLARKCGGVGVHAAFHLGPAAVGARFTVASRHKARRETRVMDPKTTLAVRWPLYYV